MIENGFGIEILAGNRALAETVHRGDTYIIVPQRRDYTLRLLVPRRSSAIRPRFEAVVSVDQKRIAPSKLAAAGAEGHVVAPSLHDSHNEVKGIWLNGDAVEPNHIGAIEVEFYGQLDSVLSLHPEKKHRRQSSPFVRGPSVARFILRYGSEEALRSAQVLA